MTSTLGDLEQLVMLALLRLGPAAYGVSIAETIEQRAGRGTTLGAVYKALTRLEQKGYVRAEMGEPTPERGGRRKRHYQITPSGRRAVAATVHAIRQLSTGLGHLIEER